MTKGLPGCWLIPVPKASLATIASQLLTGFLSTDAVLWIYRIQQTHLVSSGAKIAKHENILKNKHVVFVFVPLKEVPKPTMVL